MCFSSSSSLQSSSQHLISILIPIYPSLCSLCSPTTYPSHQRLHHRRPRSTSSWACLRIFTSNTTNNTINRCLDTDRRATFRLTDPQLCSLYITTVRASAGGRAAICYPYSPKPLNISYVAEIRGFLLTQGSFPLADNL